VKLCGASGCTTTDDQGIGVAFDDSRHSGPPSGPAPFLRALVRFREPVPLGQDPPKHPRTSPVWFVLVPGQKLIRSRESSGWLKVEDHGGLREFLARVKPYPASRFPGWLRSTLEAGTARPARPAAPGASVDDGGPPVARRTAGCRRCSGARSRSRAALAGPWARRPASG
jgi:hypothetical protein